MAQFKAEGFRHGVETKGESFVCCSPDFPMRGERGSFVDAHFYMTPDEARMLAAALLSAAAYCEIPMVAAEHAAESPQVTP